MGKLIAEFTRANRTALADAGQRAKDVQVAELRRSTGDLVMSGVGTRGARVGARYWLSGDTVVVQATGPAHLLERPSKAHQITVRRRRGTARALATPYGPRYRVQHPGVRRPPQPWERGYRRARPVVTTVIERKYGTAFGRAMRGI